MTGTQRADVQRGLHGRRTRRSPSPCSSPVAGVESGTGHHRGQTGTRQRARQTEVRGGTFQCRAEVQPSGIIRRRKTEQDHRAQQLGKWRGAEQCKGTREEGTIIKNLANPDTKTQGGKDRRLSQNRGCSNFGADPSSRLFFAKKKSILEPRK